MQHLIHVIWLKMRIIGLVGFYFAWNNNLDEFLAASTPIREKECIYVPRVRSFLNEQGQRVPWAFEVMSRRNVGKGVQVKAWVLHHYQGDTRVSHLREGDHPFGIVVAPALEE